MEPLTKQNGIKKKNETITAKARVHKKQTNTHTEANINNEV